MDINEIFKELDELFKKNEIDKVEPFLTDCLVNARETNNFGIYISVGNELIGFYRSISAYQKAVSMAEDVLYLMKKLNLEDTEHYATTLLNIATAYRAAGQVDQAYEYYETALAIYEKLLPPNDYRFASLYNNLSILLEGQDKNEEAVAYLEKALFIIKELDETSVEYATSLTNLALLNFKQNKVEEAKEKLELALTIFDKKGENTDAHYSAALAGVGEAYYHMKEYQKSLDAYEKALEEIQKHFGENESYSLISQNCAAICDQLGDTPKAEDYRKRANNK
ncbi:MAG: tetratricopeptide repeat protein [Lachnospiraceae bacterium]|nr:tetratricopeptide repeat protein [Lachnospiraceae bacterium]